MSKFTDLLHPRFDGVHHLGFFIPVRIALPFLNRCLSGKFGDFFLPVFSACFLPVGFSAQRRTPSGPYAFEVHTRPHRRRHRTACALGLILFLHGLHLPHFCDYCTPILASPLCAFAVPSPPPPLLSLCVPVGHRPQGNAFFSVLPFPCQACNICPPAPHRAFSHIPRTLFPSPTRP